MALSLGWNFTSLAAGCSRPSVWRPGWKPCGEVLRSFAMRSCLRWYLVEWCWAGGGLEVVNFKWIERSGCTRFFRLRPFLGVWTSDLCRGPCCNQHRPEAYPTVQDYVAGIAAVQALVKQNHARSHPVILVMKGRESRTICCLALLLFVGNKDVHLLPKRLVDGEFVGRFFLWMVAQLWHGCSLMRCKGAVAGKHPVPVEVANC